MKSYNIKSLVYDPVADFEELNAHYQQSAIKSLADQSDFDIIVIANNFASKFLKNLSNYKDQGTYQFIIFETLKSYNDLFISKKFKKNTDFGRISEINDAFQNCYLGTPLTQIYFEKLYGLYYLY